MFISDLNNQSLVECRKKYTKKAYDNLIEHVKNNKGALENDERFIELAKKLNYQVNLKEQIYEKMVNSLLNREDEIVYLIKDCGYNNFYSVVSTICGLPINNLDEYSKALEKLIDEKVKMYYAWENKEKKKRKKQEAERIRIENAKKEKKQKIIKRVVIITCVVLVTFFGGNLIYKNIIYPSIRPYDQDVLEFFNNTYNYEEEFDIDKMKSINEKALEFKNKNIENKILKKATNSFVKGASIQNAEKEINNNWKKGISYKYAALSTLISNDMVDENNEDIIKNIVKSSITYKLNALCKDKKNLKLKKYQGGGYYIEMECYNNTGYDLSYNGLVMTLNGETLYGSSMIYWCNEKKHCFTFSSNNNSDISLDKLLSQKKFTCSVMYKFGPIVDVNKRYSGKNHRHVY